MNLKINESCGKMESHIKKNWIKYALMLGLFGAGIIAGGICFSSIKNSNEDMLSIKQLIEQMLDVIVVQRWQVVNEYFFKDLKKILLLTIISSSMIGLPLLLIWIFYDGLSLSFSIASLVAVYGILKGNLISIILLFIPNLLYLVATMITTVSSIKMINNFLKMKKSLKIETMRHLIVCALSSSIIGITFFIRIFSMNFIENLVK